MNLRYHFLLVLCCLFFGLTGALAQKADAGTAWKKTVSRVIDWKPVHKAESHHLKEMRKDSVIFEMIVNAVLSDGISAFDTSDLTFTIPVKSTAITDLLKDKSDTVTLLDPIDGSERTKVVTLPFQYSSVHKYRIIEDWVFNPSTMKTELTVTAIGPLVARYSDDDETIGTKPLFWLRYGDIKNIVNRYGQYHPDNTLAGLIWQDYFASDIKPAEAK